MRYSPLSDRPKSELVFLLCIASAIAFNVDLATKTIHNGPTDSMFGFSVAQHKENGQSWLIIGAPKAHTNQPGVERGGAVYRCTPDLHNRCQQIPFDQTGSEVSFVNGEYVTSENKSNQWFGATVQSSGEDGVVVACAPRYVYHAGNIARLGPVGVCWTVSHDFRISKKYSPCRDPLLWGHHRQGYCQAGFSAAVTKDKNWLYIGAVGSWYCQGQMYLQNLITDRVEYQTRESPGDYDDSYLGYSSAAGEFTGDNNTDVAVGMPRANITGKVVLFDSKLNNLLNITGEQIGAYFGYSLCVADLNGDNLDDIIIGAPLYSDFEAKRGQYEEGRVYIAYQNSKHMFDERDHLDGIHPKGRFGLALTSLGDINRDGYQDFAVGAPYGGEDGKGVIFIYHGSASGVRKNTSQVIRSSDIKEDVINTFGFSLSGGLDLDNNHYPDLLVGAYDSNQAIYFRSRPVVNVTGRIETKVESISLDEKTCTIKVDKKSDKNPCFDFSFCLKYTGIGVEPELEFIYEINLDSQKENSSRVFFKTETDKSVYNKTITLRKDSNHCVNNSAYVANDIRDKLAPIVISLKYFLIDPYPSVRILKPIVNEDVPNEYTKQITIRKNCKKADICIPDLVLDVIPNEKKFFDGSGKRIELDIILSNAGEDAFEAMLYLSKPLDVDYFNIIEKNPDFPIICGGATPEENELICNIANPLPANKTLRFTVLLEPFAVLTMSMKEFQFDIVVNSTNPELKEHLFDNFQTVKIPVIVEAEFLLGGISEPEVVSYNKSAPVPIHKDTANDIGPEVIHIYEVKNEGPSTIKEAAVHILWPSYNLEEEPLLYLIDNPLIEGKRAKCEENEDDVNPLYVKKEELKPTKNISVGHLQINSIGNKNIKSQEDHGVLQRKLRSMENSLQRELKNCGPTKCTHFRCSISNLGKGEKVFFTVKSRLWRESINKLNLEVVKISSKLVAVIKRLPYSSDPGHSLYKTFAVSTKVQLEDISLKPPYLPWWIIVLAVCGGLLLLALLVILLWKLGFFKRKRPQEQLEKPLLHKNGYQMTSGDEAL